MPLKEIGKSLLCGILFISSFYWSLVLTLLVPKQSFAIVFFFALLTDVLLGLLLAADRSQFVFYKWLISLPAVAVTFFCYRQSGFVYYWLNRIRPGYGNLSAGGGFAAAGYLLIFCVGFLAALGIAILLTRRKMKRP